MSREKQTKELIDVLNAWGISEYIPHHTEIAMLAHYIVSKDYRKQSEGEWVVKAYPVDSDEVIIIPYEEHQHNEPYCSICGEYALLNGGGDYVVSNYCPNCGAKMKGGAE